MKFVCLEGAKMPANVETMYSAVDTPWHRIGTVTDKAVNSEQAISHAGLDWTVSTRPVVTFDKANETEGNFIDIPDTFATVRDSDDTVLGVVGDRYKVVQNKECFNFLDTVVDDSEATYETAGSLNNGKIVWMMLNLGKEIKVDEDITVPYLLMVNSHDGSTSVRGLPTPIRVVCSNTLRLALSSNAYKGFSFRHTQNVDGRIQQARTLLNLSYEYVDGFQEEMEKLLDTTVTDDMFYDVLENLMPLPMAKENNASQVSRVNQQRSSIEKLWYEPEFANQQGTAWSLLNAVSNYEQWQSHLRGETSRDERIAIKTVQNTESPLTQKAWNLVRA
jgi:phage/plasmid-like protein (TIGR03299 family)